MLKLALRLMRNSVKRKAGCDISTVSPLDVVPRSAIPAMFGHGEEDSFINIQHSGAQHLARSRSWLNPSDHQRGGKRRLPSVQGTQELPWVSGLEVGLSLLHGCLGFVPREAFVRSSCLQLLQQLSASLILPPAVALCLALLLSCTSCSCPAVKLYEAYNSTADAPVYKNLVRFKGDHNHPRPAFFYSSVCCFFHQQLKLDQVLLGGNPVSDIPAQTCPISRSLLCCAGRV